MASEGTSVASIELAWQAVSLEERLELISKSQASGIIASIACIMTMGAIGYGLDQIYFLVAGFASCTFIFPLFSSYCWRRGKPALILAYLAVRAVGRRYAYAFNVPDIDIVLIYRGVMKQHFRDEEEEEYARQTLTVGVDTSIGAPKDVWIMLMRGGLLLLSEEPGGAKLEFLSHISHESIVAPSDDPDMPEGTLQIRGVGSSKGQEILLGSRYPGAHFVFTKQLEYIVQEHLAWQESQERLRQATA